MKDIEKVISTLNAKGLFGEIKVIESLLEKLEVKEVSGHARQEAEKLLQMNTVLMPDENRVIENLLKELESTERKLAEAGKYRGLYNSINEMMCELGAQGEITTRSTLVSNVMDALHDIDDGVFKPEPDYEVSKRVINAASECMNHIGTHEEGVRLYKALEKALSDYEANKG